MSADRRRPTLDRDRQLFAQLTHTEHMKGWVACATSRALPADSSRDFARGYRECMVDSSARGAA